MNITYFLNKIKGRAGEHYPYVITLILMVFVGIGAFYLGYIAHAETVSASPVAISCPEEAYIRHTKVSAGGMQAGSAGSTLATTGAFVASKNGTKYYPMACKGVSRIKEENKVWFQTIAEAEARGYTPAVGC